MGIGPFEILIVIAVLLLIIGPRRVTNMARSLGRGAQDFVAEITGDKKSADSKPSALGDGDEEDDESSKTPDKR